MPREQYEFLLCGRKQNPDSVKAFAPRGPVQAQSAPGARHKARLPFASHTMDSPMDPPSAPRTKPQKRIISRHHLEAFLASPTHADLVAFLERLNSSVIGVKLSDPVVERPVRAPPLPLTFLLSHC